MKFLLVALIIFALLSCDNSSNEEVDEEATTDFPSAIQFPDSDEDQDGSDAKSSLPDEIEVSLTLSSPDNLRVGEGDQISEGDILVSQPNEVRRIQAQLDRLLLDLERLEAVAIPNRDVPSLPPADFSAQVSAIDKQELVIAQIQDEIAVQEKKIAEIRENALPERQLASVSGAGNFDNGESRNALILQHEQSKRDDLLSRLEREQAELDLKKAELKSEHQQRDYQEYRRELEVSRVERDHADRISQRNFNERMIRERISQKQEELALLSAIKSPFSGQVRSLSWEGMSNSQIQVTLLIEVSDD
ncbi:MAG: hypothetical protein ACLFTJ_02540 [Halothece sp.]